MTRPPVVWALAVSLVALSCNLAGTDRSVQAPTVPRVPVVAESASNPQAVVEPVDAPAPPTDVQRISDYLVRQPVTMHRVDAGLLAETIVVEAREHGFDPWLVVSVMEVESHFDRRAVSEAGALGLMQILPTTGREVAHWDGVAWSGRQTLFDPVVNVQLGVAYLEYLRDWFGDLETTLAAYNWGPGRIRSRIEHGRPLPVAYPRRVLDRYSLHTPSGAQAFGGPGTS
ncbi:lytic transglycosylase domain-containing protein [Myxococcota bacterium]|nr:lytic transglycosylase domain-containing protein [Myxococcota bacterium]